MFDISFLINEVGFFKDKSSATNGFKVFLVKEINLIQEICGDLKLFNIPKNVPKICIKLCAAGIFGCRNCICSI